MGHRIGIEKKKRMKNKKPINSDGTNQGSRLPRSCVHHQKKAGRIIISVFLEGVSSFEGQSRHTISEYGTPVRACIALKCFIFDPAK